MPFRGRIVQGKYYEEGLPTFYHGLVEQIVEAANEKKKVCFYPSFNTFQIGSRIRTQDAQAIRKVKKAKDTANFDLFLDNTKGHATTLLSIRDPISLRVLCVLLFDSENKGSVSANRFLKSDPVRFPKAPGDYGESWFHDQEEIFKKYLEEIFSIEGKAWTSLEEGELIINQEAKAIFKRLHSWTQLENEEPPPHIDLVYGWYQDKESGKNYFKIHYTRKIPFLNASHKLQFAPNDQNCVLYSTLFMKALITMLQQPEVEEKVIIWSRTLANQPADFEQAQQELLNLFKEGIKPYLPCFFDPSTGKPKPYSQLQKFFLDYRWEIGNVGLDLAHPIRKEHQLLLQDFLEKNATYEKIWENLKNIPIDFTYLKQEDQITLQEKELLRQVEQERKELEFFLQENGDSNTLLQERVQAIRQALSSKTQAIVEEACTQRKEVKQAQSWKALSFCIVALGGAVSLMAEEVPLFGAGLACVGAASFFSRGRLRNRQPTPEPARENTVVNLSARMHILA